MEPDHLLIRTANSNSMGGKVIIVFNLHKQSFQARLTGLHEASRAIDLINNNDISIHHGEISFTIDSEDVMIFYI